MNAAGFDAFDYADFSVDKSTQEWQIFHKRTISEILRYVAPDEVRICDIGCGLGDWLNECDKVGWSTFGIALSEGEIREAKKRTIAKLAAWDINNGLPFEENFDVITCFDTLEHVSDPERSLAIINKKLTNRGVLLFTVPSIHFGFYTSKKWTRPDHVPLPMIRNWKNTHVSLLTIRNWKKITLNSRFRIVSSKTIFPYLSQKKGAKALLSRLIARIGFGSTLRVIAIKDDLG